MSKMQRDKGLSILLPWPPSTNSLWRAIRGRNIMAARYRDWIAAATDALNQQHHHSIIGPVDIRLDLCPPTKRRYDPDNFVKAVLDFLAGKEIIDGDDSRTIRQLTVTCCAGFNGVWADIEPLGHTSEEEE